MPLLTLPGFIRRFSSMLPALAFLCAAPLSAYATTEIMFFGDSLVAGYGLKPKEALPPQVEIALREKGFDIIAMNDGVSGDTTSGGRSRLEWALNRKQPKVVVLALGGNDLLRGVKPSVIYDNLDAMLQMLLKRKIKVLLVRVVAMENYDPAYVSEFNAIFPQLGQRYNIPVYPFFLEGIFGNAGYLLPDGVHPNALGVQYIAGHLSNYLASTQWLDKLPQKQQPQATLPTQQ